MQLTEHGFVGHGPANLVLSNGVSLTDSNFRECAAPFFVFLSLMHCKTLRSVSLNSVTRLYRTLFTVDTSSTKHCMQERKGMMRCILCPGLVLSV